MVGLVLQFNRLKNKFLGGKKDGGDGERKKEKEEKKSESASKGNSVIGWIKNKLSWNKASSSAAGYHPPDNEPVQHTAAMEESKSAEIELARAEPKVECCFACSGVAAAPSHGHCLVLQVETQSAGQMSLGAQDGNTRHSIHDRQTKSKSSAWMPNISITMPSLSGIVVSVWQQTTVSANPTASQRL